MRNESEKYGTYYGELTPYNSEHYYGYWDLSETQDFVENIKEAGVTEVLLDIEDGDDNSSTMFFETNDKTDFKELILMIVAIRPDEFSEESENHFRMWFD